MQGYIKIFRQIADNDIWLLKPFSEGQAWIDLLLITTFDKGFIKTKNGQIIELKKGDCGFSQLSLSNRWGWSRGKVKRFLDLLSKLKMIQQKNYGNYTIISILNYEKFQNDTINNTTNKSINGQQIEQQTDTINNVKNGKNVKNVVSINRKFIKPSLEEVKQYCLDRHNNISAEKFIDYYEANGWRVGHNPMKDWKAAVRIWERKEKENSPPEELSREELKKRINARLDAMEEERKRNGWQ